MLLMSTLTLPNDTIVGNAGVSYKQHPPEGEWDAIAIGSGIGGLASAALLAQRAGKRVLVLERHYTAGGFTHVFHRPGYEWDVGVHYIGEMGAGEPMRALLDEITEGRLKWNAMPEVYDRIRIADRSYDFVSGAERYAERMREYFPREGAAIGRYVAQVHDAARASRLFFAEKAIPAALARVAGPLMRRRFLSYARRTTAETLARLTGNGELIAVLTGHWGNYGLPPGQSSFGMHAVIAEHYLEGAFYPVGGASRIAASIAPAIERAGGRILVGAEVRQILLDARNRAIGVRMADGRELRAPLILSDAGAWNTYGRLLPPDAPGRAQSLAEIECIPNSMGHLSLYVGLRRDAARRRGSDGPSNSECIRFPRATARAPARPAAAACRTCSRLPRRSGSGAPATRGHPPCGRQSPGSARPAGFAGPRRPPGSGRPRARSPARYWRRCAMRRPPDKMRPPDNVRR